MAASGTPTRASSPLQMDSRTSLARQPKLSPTGRLLLVAPIVEDENGGDSHGREVQAGATRAHRPAPYLGRLLRERSVKRVARRQRRYQVRQVHYSHPKARPGKPFTAPLICGTWHTNSLWNSPCPAPKLNWTLVN